MTKFTKDPDARLDYRVDWASWLVDDDTITTASWIVPTGITQHSVSNDTTSATIWLTGGTVGETYKVTSRITTVQNRIDDRTMEIFVTQR